MDILLDKSILVVDDEESILQTISISLKKHGYQVYSASDGRTALSVARQNSFKFALLDIHLPDMSGIELTQKLKQYHPNIVIILMTGYPGIKTAVEAVHHQVYDYLIKPFLFDQVLSSIERARADFRMREENDRSLKRIQQLEEENRELRKMLEELMPDINQNKPQLVDKYRHLLSNLDQAISSYTQKK